MNNYRKKMNFNLWCMPLILLMVTKPCQGFDFTMERREYLVKNQTYCGLLQCQVDTVSDTNMASLIKMDIYYFNNEQLLVSMLAVNSDIQVHTGNNTIVIGSMSKNHGECHVYFSDVSNCSETSFMCTIQFKNSKHGKEFAKKITLPINSDKNEADSYVKSQISIEHKIFDKAGVIKKTLKPNTNLLDEGMGFSFRLGNPSLINSDEISNQRKKTEIIPWQIATNNFEQKLSDFEVNIGKQLDIFMNQISNKIEDTKIISKEINLKLNELKEQELIRKSEQSISSLMQSLNDPKLSNLERRMDDIIDKIDQVNVSLNLNDLRAHADVLWIIQNLGFLLDENRLIGLNVSSLGIKVTEILNYERHMNKTIKETLKNERHWYAIMTEILKNERQMNDTIKEILKNDRQMNDTIKEILNNDIKNNDTMKEFQNEVKTIDKILKELRNDHETIETSLVNVTRSLNNTLKVKQLELKCERGMSSAQGSRVITSLDNKKQVLCDTETDGGGWIIIQRRVNGLVNFTRNWNDYKDGFGSLYGDFWIGNELISRITSKEIYTLRIDMRQGSNAYRAEYDSFMVKNESDNYRLHLGVFSGNIKDALRRHNNMAFSTQDRDNDNYSGGNCAQDYKSGWWYEVCRDSHLNGVWGLNTEIGLYWNDHSGRKDFDFVEMKLRLK